MQWTVLFNAHLMTHVISQTISSLIEYELDYTTTHYNKEVLRKHDTLTSVDNIVQYCENFESTKKDRMILNASLSPSVSTIHADFELAKEEIVAAVSAYKRQTQSQFQSQSKINEVKLCTYCGYSQHGKKQSCPASQMWDERSFF